MAAYSFMDLRNSILRNSSLSSYLNGEFVNLPCEPY